MFLMLSGLVSNTKIVINADRIIRITPSNENNGSVIMMMDGTKLFAHETVGDIFEALGYYREENTFDLTTEPFRRQEDGDMDRGGV